VPGRDAITPDGLKACASGWPTVGAMDFSAMVLTMWLPPEDSPESDERVLEIAIEQSLLAGELGFNPWFTEHHFRGAWHSNPLQFAAYIAPQLPPERYLGFGVLSTPYYHPVRLVESMNLLDQLMRGRTLYGLGSGFPGLEPLGLGVEAEYHASGRAAAETLDVVERLWDYRTGDPPYTFATPTNRGTIRRRVVPAPYRKHRPTVIRTASRNAAVVNAAQKGWPAFLGTFGSESSLAEQVRLYRTTLAAANHSPEVVAECLRWCTVDWLSVAVAETDAAAEAAVAEAKAERLTIRRNYVEQYGAVRGPAVGVPHGPEQSEGFKAGADMRETIAGSPETVARKVGELVELGINHLLIRFLGEWTGATRHVSETSMRLFAREVIPRFRDIAPPREPLAIS
jgi:alkanesulfonate monooxygenase SsuD/methylene tetrahydromethanopterin reductase-like flavin-dependent oxidoreductase (luciferase family)